MAPAKKKLIIVVIVIIFVLVLYSTIKRNSVTPDTTTKLGNFGSAPQAMMEELSASRAIGLSPIQPGGTADLEDVTKEDRLIIRTAAFSIVSANVQASVDQLTSYAASAGGFIANVNVTNLERSPYAVVNFRVPAERFEETRQLIRSLGLKVVIEGVTGQDITEQYVDTEARLKNLRASEEQFLAIMKQAVKVEEVLAVQQQLERVRGQIEQSQGRLQYLERSALLATFTVTISSDEEDLPIIDPVDRWRPLAIAKEALRALIKTFQGLGTRLIWLVIYAPIWLPVLLIVWLLYRRLNKV
ncbi:MAG: DUF4349 domain-containing protein [bacterium]